MTTDIKTTPTTQTARLAGLGSGILALGVLLGAFGAHGLKSFATPKAIGWWETATLYLFIHALGVLAIAIFANFNWCNVRPAYCLMAGMAIFCGSLYGMALGLPTWFGAITPIGGTLFVVGWAWLCVQLFRVK